MNGRLYKWNGTTWVDADTNSATQKDVALSAGNLTTLKDRLAVSMNDDGTLKASPTAVIDEFKDNALAITYVSTNSFTTPNDLTSTFTQYRKVKCVLSASYVVTSVTASTYDSGTNKTTVTLKDSVIDATITEVKYGVIQDGLPENVLTSGTNSTIGTANITTLNMSGAINQALTTMASASTMSIGAAPANYIIVTGTTTITAFDSITAGAVRTLRFSDTVTVTYNATTMLLPGATNIVAYAGDVLTFVSGGSGIWRCTDIQRYKTFRGVKVYNNSGGTQSIATTATTKIIFNITEFDTDSFWNPSTTRIEIPAGVSYVKLVGIVSWIDAYTTEGTRRGGWLYKNGSLLVPSSCAAGSPNCHNNVSSGAVPVTSGDYFELYAVNGDTIAKNISQSPVNTSLTMEVIA
jgi:hypothetical protein